MLRMKMTPKEVKEDQSNIGKNMDRFTKVSNKIEGKIETDYKTRKYPDGNIV